MIKEKLLKKEILKERLGNKINIITKFIFIFVFMLVVGCKKDILSVDKFNSIMKKNDYSTIDLSDKNIKKLLAVGNHFQVYYYIFVNNKTARNNLNKELKKYSKKDIDKSIKDNLIIYEIDKNKIYSVYSIIDNTYININTTKNNMGDVQNILEKLGYY